MLVIERVTDDPKKVTVVGVRNDQGGDTEPSVEPRPMAHSDFNDNPGHFLPQE